MLWGVNGRQRSPLLAQHVWKRKYLILALLLLIWPQCPAKCVSFGSEVIEVPLSSDTKAWTSSQQTFNFLGPKVIFYCLKVLMCLDAQSGQAPVRHE